MSFKENIEQENNEIIKNLKEEGYANKIINYAEFLEIYHRYENIMGELEFAYLLGLNYEKYRCLRTRGNRTRILVQMASKELANEIRTKLQQKGYTNKKIDYIEFLDLYEEYSKQITEKEFAKIIGITYSRYRNIKNRGGKTIILETKIDREKIKNEVETKYGSIEVDYNQFLNIYEEYRQYINDEIKFAEIIGISIHSFSGIKYAKSKAKILKQDEISNELKIKIQNEIIEKGFKNKLISYSEFLILYEPYKNKMTEIQFAKIIGISDVKHRNMKYYNNKTYVFGKGKKGIPQERIEEIQNELIEQGYANKHIEYLELEKIYSKYEKEMDEIQFAEIIGISYGNYMSIKNKGDRAIILKSENISKRIIQEILDNEDIKQVLGQLIDYEQFQKLYKPYSNWMTQAQFAQIIGIPYTKFHNFKKYRVRVDILYSQKVRIKHIVRESRRYSLNEIEEFCEKYKCNINDFLRIVCYTDYDNIIKEYYEVLKDKGIFIGDKPIDAEMMTKYGEEIIRFIDTKSKLIGNLYKQNRFCDDVASDTIMYITQKRGNLFENFDEERALKGIKDIAYKYIKYMYLTHLRLKKVSIDENFGDHHRYIIDKSQDTEDLVIEKLKNENNDIYEKCINLLQYYHDMGLSSLETIEKVSKKLELSKEDMLDMMKKCLIERNKVKQTDEGEYYL